MDGKLTGMFRVPALLVLLVLTGFAAAENKPAEHPLAPAIKIAQSSLDTIAESKDYTAVFFKEEVLGNRKLSHTCNVKVRHEPFSVYMRFLKPHDGREVIYVDGANGGNLLAHETGLAALVGTVALSPRSNEAMSESRYPITDMGIKMLVQRIIEQWEEESKYGECDVKYYPQAKLGDVECKVIESSHPQPRKQFKHQLTRLYIEKKTNLPIRVEQWAFPSQPGGQPIMVEQYTYSKIQLDAGLTDIDFDTRNPNYGY